MNTTNQNAISLFGNLRSLNGHEKVVETDGNPKVVQQPYQFDAKTVWAVARNLNTLKRHIEVFEEARATLVRNAEANGGPDGRKSLEAGILELLKEKIEVDGITKIKLAGLNLDKNPIPPGTLAELAELIEE